MEKNDVKKKRGSVVWALGLSWLSTLLLAILAIFLMLLTTICSEGFMRKQVTRSSFADYAYSYLYDNYVSYGASTGFDADVMTSTLSRDQINTDMEQAVTDLYAGNTAVNARENIKTDLNAVLVADLNSRGKDVTEDVASAVEIVADACRLDYANYVAIPLASQLYTVITKVDRLALPGVIVTALLCAVSLVLMLRLAGSSRLGVRCLTFTFTAESDDLTYLYFPTDYPRDCTLFLDGEEWGEAMGNDSDCILTLGRFEPGSTHTIALQPRNQKFYLRTNQTYLWTLDEEALKSAYTVLSQGNWKILPDFKEDRLEGTVTVPEGCTLLFTSVPYEEGWVVTVDGREVQPVLTERTVQNEKTGEEKTEQTACLDALVAFRITPGVHSVRLEYKPASVFYGGLISLLAVAVLFLMAVLDYGILRPLRRKKRSEKEAPPAVPEGDASESAEPADPTDHAPVEKSVNERPETDKTAGRKKTEAKRGKSPSGEKGKGRR